MDRSRDRRGFGRGTEGRRGGWLLVEAAIAMTVITVGILGFLFTFQANFRATQELGCRDLARVALDNAVETLRSANFSTLYATRQDTTIPAAGLVASNGSPAFVAIHFDVNETALPAAYGPVLDIDGDGQMHTADASTGYVLLPTRLILQYRMSYGTETKIQFLVLRQ